MNKQKGLAPILIVLLIAVALGGYLIYQKQPKSFVPQTTETSPSPSQTPDQNKAEFVPGEVIVGIKSGIKVKDAEQFIKSFNLKYKAPYKRLDFENKKEVPYDPEDIIGEKLFWFNVSVPVGEENKWVKIFESNSIVKYAQLNDYARAMRPVSPK